MSRLGFPGFPGEAMRFFRSLKRNNRREWFQPRKQEYLDHVRAPMEQLVAALNAEMMKYAPDYVREPGDAIYRIYRDTRFSPDKTPYKTHIAAIFPRRTLAKHAGGGFYFSVSPTEVEIAGGVYMPGPDELRVIRSHLLENHTQFRRILAKPTLKQLMGSMSGSQLSRVPKGFPCDHPAADFMRYKQWLFYVTLEPAIATAPNLLDEIVSRFRAMTPFVEFLNAPLIKTNRKPTKEFFA